MPKFVKFIALAIPVFGLGAYSSYRDYEEPMRFSAQGIASQIEWQSKNHGIPRIEIKLANGVTKRFSSTRIVLSPSLIAVGDNFAKHKNSKFCQINGKEVQCID